MRLLAPDVGFRGLTPRRIWEASTPAEVSDADGRSTVEQQVYFRADGGRLTYLRIVCSGYRPQSKTAS